MYQVPGNYIKKVNVKEGSNELGKWEDLKEEYVLFPSSESKEDYIDDHEKVNKFGTGVGDYFPNYVGIIGEGLYVDDNLTDLKINIRSEEHTSELQSRGHLVCRLLLEKKNT